MRIVLLPLVFLLLTAAKHSYQPAAPVTVSCSGQDDCAAKWGRAMRWVSARRSNYVDEVTDTRIVASPVVLADGYNVTKIPTAANSYDIEMTVSCWSLTRCDWQAANSDFESAVTGTSESK